MTKQHISFAVAVVIIILAVLVFAFLPKKEVAEAPVLEDVSVEALDVAPPSANPLESAAPAVNPLEKTNPFKDEYKNPFE